MPTQGRYSNIAHVIASIITAFSVRVSRKRGAVSVIVSVVNWPRSSLSDLSATTALIVVLSI